MLGEVAHLLVEAAHPEKIRPFGSYARDYFNEGSDLNLLIILPTVVDRFEEMDRLRLEPPDMGVAIDVAVYSRDNMEERRHLLATMLYHVLREGNVLHGAAWART